MAISALESASILGVFNDVERSTSASTSNTTIDSDEFLKLLCTQLQCQDPLDPMDTDEMTSTLTSFSQLEQSTIMNDYLQELVTYQSSINNSLALECIGKTVTVSGNEFSLTDGVAEELSYELSGDAGQVSVTIYDESGNAVRTIEMSDVSDGSHLLAWDGTDGNGETLPDGTYTFEVTAYDSSGDAVAATTSVACEITGVVYRDGVPYLVTENREVPYGRMTGVSAS